MTKNVKKDKYYLKLVEASSPITKSPATPFNGMVLGLKEVTACPVPVGTVSQDYGYSYRGSSPVYPRPVALICTTKLLEVKLKGKIGRPIPLTFDHGESEDLFTGVVLDDNEQDFTITKSGGDYYLVGNKEGDFYIEVKVQYNECTVCSLRVEVTVEKNSTQNPGLGGEEDLDDTDRDCEEIFAEGQVQLYKAKDTYRWQIDPTSTMNVDNNIKLKFGASTTLQGASYWDGIKYIYASYWIINNQGDASPDVPKMMYGFNNSQKVIEDVIQGFVNTDISEGWADFNNEAYNRYGVTSCASTVDKASLWASSQLKVPFIIDDDSKWLTESPILETVVAKFKEIHLHKLVTLARARDIVADSPGTFTGAFVSDVLPLKEHLGFLNIEPQLDNYKFDESEIFFPMDYKSTGNEWYDVVYTPNADYENHHYDTNYTAKEQKALITGAVAIHELAHALDNRYFDFKGTLLTDEQGWLNLSGWGAKRADGTYAPLKKTELGNSGNRKFPATPYGCTSPSEDFAEAYAIYKYNPSFLCYYHNEKFCYIKRKEQELFTLLGETATPPSHDCGC